MPSKIPLVQLPQSAENDSDMKQAARQVADALETSGFLLVQSHHLSKELQQKAIQATEEILNDKENSDSILHPVDPKKYIMVENTDSITTLKAQDEQKKVLDEYWTAMEKVKHQVLQCISLGLGLSVGYFSECHSKNNSCLRLLHYPVPEMSGSDESQLVIRCKAHSDYGSVTLLTTDGVGGLQAFIDDTWTDVPYVEGSIVVNIGSLLSDWTQDSDISASLGSSSSETAGMTVEEYIKFRAGGDNRDRVGVAFTSSETNRIEGKSDEQ